MVSFTSHVPLISHTLILPMIALSFIHTHRAWDHVCVCVYHADVRSSVSLTQMYVGKTLSGFCQLQFCKTTTKLPLFPSGGGFLEIKKLLFIFSVSHQDALCVSSSSDKGVRCYFLSRKTQLFKMFSFFQCSIVYIHVYLSSSYAFVSTWKLILSLHMQVGL